MQLDDRVGDAIERAVRAHHRRRLRRIGWEHALDAVGPDWAGGDPPPRPDNAVEKLVVGDDRVAFVGGIDLTSYAGNRLDSRDHPARGEIGWHDAAARLEGPVVSDVAEHFALRWREVTGEALPAPRAPEAAGKIEVQLLRTVPERV